MRIIPISLFCIFAISSTSLSQNFQFYQQTGDSSPTSGGRAESIAVDTDGSIILYGEFAGNARFGLIVFDHDGLFLAKYDKSGTLLWAKGSKNDNDPLNGGGLAHSVAIDNQNNYLVAGSFGKIIKLGFGEPNATELSSDGEAGYVAKYSKDGTLVWARSAVGEALSSRRFTSVSADADGNVFVGAWFDKPTVFGKGTPKEKTIGAGSSLAKYSSTGDLQWVNQVTSMVAGISVKVDKSNNVIVAVPNYPEQSLVKYKHDGSIIWKKSYPFGPGKMAVDTEGNIYVTGLFAATVTYSTTTTGGSIVSAGLADMYISKLNSDGNILWVRSAGSKGNDLGRSLAIDSKNNVFVTGSIEGDATFGDSETTKLLKGSGKADIFVAKYSTNGTFIWATVAGGSDDEEGNGIEVDGLGNSYVGGYSRSKDLVFGKGESLQKTFSAYGYSDTFFAKFKFSEEPLEVVTAIESKIQERFIIYPNPVSDALNIKLNAYQPSPVNIKIRDISGREMFSGSIHYDRDMVEQTVDVKSLAKGMYILEICDYNKQWFSKIIVK